MTKKPKNKITSFDTDSPYDELKMADLHIDSILPEKKRQKKKAEED